LVKSVIFPGPIPSSTARQAITEAETQSLDLDACAARAAQHFDGAAFAEYAAKLRRTAGEGNSFFFFWPKKWGGYRKKIEVSGPKIVALG
jgi:hypothetical protein